MITIRKSKDRGHFDHGWLKANHTFSFGEYYDPQYNNFRTLRVINEDTVAPSEGFGTHPHRDMEIITYVVEGALEHKDSMGTGSVIKRGDIQVMSAGKGVSHSEFNHSSKESVHLLQIWILPDKKGLEPSYQQKYFSKEEKKNVLCELIGTGKNSLRIHQNVQLYASLLESEEALEYMLKDKHSAWIQVISGAISVNDYDLSAGDGAAVSDEELLILQSQKPAEFLLFDLGSNG